jgi:hypothetical protein
MPRARATSGPWKVLVGMNYPPNDRRAEPGEIVNDLPSSDVPWMLEQNLIGPVEAVEQGEDD